MKYSSNDFQKEHQIIKQFRKLILKIQEPSKYHPSESSCVRCLIVARKRDTRNLQNLIRKYPDLYQRALQPDPALPTLGEVLGGVQ